MIKKLYKSPVAKFHKLNTSRIVCTSGSIDDISPLNDVEATEADTDEKKAMFWGSQW